MCALQYYSCRFLLLYLPLSPLYPNTCSMCPSAVRVLVVKRIGEGGVGKRRPWEKILQSCSIEEGESAASLSSFHYDQLARPPGESDGCMRTHVGEGDISSKYFDTSLDRPWIHRCTMDGRADIAMGVSVLCQYITPLHVSRCVCIGLVHFRNTK